MRDRDEFIAWVVFQRRLGKPPTLNDIYNYLVEPLRELPENFPLKHARPHLAHGRTLPLTAKDINEIRRVWRESRGKLTLKALGKRFQIGEVMAHNIITNKIYKV